MGGRLDPPLVKEGLINFDEIEEQWIPDLFLHKTVYTGKAKRLNFHLMMLLLRQPGESKASPKFYNLTNVSRIFATKTLYCLTISSSISTKR